jgi:hypothetical protein
LHHLLLDGDAERACRELDAASLFDAERSGQIDHAGEGERVFDLVAFEVICPWWSDCPLALNGTNSTSEATAASGVLAFMEPPCCTG